MCPGGPFDSDALGDGGFRCVVGFAEVRAAGGDGFLGVPAVLFTGLPGGFLAALLGGVRVAGRDVPLAPENLAGLLLDREPPAQQPCSAQRLSTAPKMATQSSHQEHQPSDRPWIQERQAWRQVWIFAEPWQCHHFVEDKE